MNSNAQLLKSRGAQHFVKSATNSDNNFRSLAFDKELTGRNGNAIILLVYKFESPGLFPGHGWNAAAEE